MSHLLALIKPDLYALALHQPWPDDPLEQVRCLDSGTRALGLSTTCAPWSRDLEDAALAEELDMADTAPASFGAFDEVTAWLAATPAAPPVFGLISGPAAWSSRVSEDEDALDIASDLAAARVRALASAGVERLVVMESVAAGIAEDRMADAHRTIIRAADHFRLDVLLILTGEAIAPEALGYRGWVGPSRGSAGLTYLAPAALESSNSLTSHLEGRSDVDEFVTGLLGAETVPDRVREAASIVTSMRTVS